MKIKNWVGCLFVFTNNTSAVKTQPYFFFNNPTTMFLSFMSLLYVLTAPLFSSFNSLQLNATRRRNMRPS